MKKANNNLHNAKLFKNDEFYTQLTDIEKELWHYKDYFKRKKVLCNCDDPHESNFYNYFSHTFEHFGLKKLTTTCFKNNSPFVFSKNKDDKAVYLEYTGASDGRCPKIEDMEVKYLKGHGDFRSIECIGILKKADVVVTNPPFSLFKQFVAQLIKYDKKFLIMGNMNAVTYKEIFPLLRDNKMWLGYNTNQTMEFALSPEYTKWSRIGEDGTKYGKVPSICWFTNIPHRKRNEEIILYKKYKGHEKDYPKYDNYNAIDVSKVNDIPKDYEGAMGVPITFLCKYNPKQFEILDANNLRTNEKTSFKSHGLIKDKDGTINGKAKYVRIVIKRRK